MSLVQSITDEETRTKHLVGDENETQVNRINRIRNSFITQMYTNYSKIPNAKSYLDFYRGAKEFCAGNKVLKVGWWFLYVLGIWYTCAILSAILKCFRFGNTIKFFALCILTSFLTFFATYFKIIF